MRALRLIAGENARKRIEQEGLTPQLVRAVVGASGGPKWLVLSGLDRVMFGDWLHGADHKIDLIGSSIGAWRMTVAAHPAPKAKLDEFLDNYFDFPFDPSHSARDITRNSYDFIDKVFPKDDRRAIVMNDKRSLNIVAVRCRGMAGAEGKLPQAFGLIAAALGNQFGRDKLAHWFDRAVFHSGEYVPFDEQWRDFSRIDVGLDDENLPDALMASGSIPLVIDPITNIKGAPEGTYRDGGFIDYHFDVPWHLDDGIVLYPHFFQFLVPGWFDKNQNGRRAGAKAMENMLLLAPSDEFVASLPHGKLTDRSDFSEMDNHSRLARWRTVVAQSERLGEEFNELLEKPDLLMDRLERPSQA